LLGLVLIFQNLGINVTTLVGGISITGIAVAFVLQNIFADLFASLSIYFDKPFATRDEIQIGEDVSIVRQIGLKTTHIKTVTSEELVMSNKELTNDRIRNYKKLQTRRFIINFTLSKETQVADILKLSNLFKKALII
jgi:small-conductance mechanosensitive channel